VQCQVPLLLPSADTYARAALRRVGYEPRCTPYWLRSIMWWLAMVRWLTPDVSVACLIPVVYFIA
jgi:hypothetical protein